MKNIIHTILDIAFPPRKEEQAWRDTNASELASLLSPAPVHDHTDIISLFDYKNNIVQDIIWSLKYDGSTHAASICAQLLYDVIVEELSTRYAYKTIEKPVLIPVPLSPRRQKERGFNQCARIIHKLQKIDCNRYFSVKNEVLEKYRETSSQTKTTGKKQRAENLRGCFRVTQKKLVGNKDIVVIDDVLTTGSTLVEITQTLKQAGARSVLCFTFAH